MLNKVLEQMTVAKVRDWFGFAPAGQGGHNHSGHGHGHGGHDHGAAEGHGHTHGVIDASIATTERGIWAIKWSFVILAVTAALQIVVVIFSGSVALLPRDNQGENQRQSG